jgi:hypothetical protein
LPVASGCAGSDGGSPFDTGDAGGAPLPQIESDGAVLYNPPPEWSGSLPLLIGKGERAISLAIDSATVYWQSGGGPVYGCALSGCPSAKPTLLSSLVGPQYGALQTLGAGDGIGVFVSLSGTTLSAFAGDDPAHSPTPYRVTGGSGFTSLVTDATHVYFIDTLPDASAVYGVAQTLYACPLGASCSSPQKLYADPSLGPLCVSDSEVFFLASGTSIRAVSTHGGKARTVCSSSTLLTQVQALSVAGGYVYFTTADYPAFVYQCPASGGEPSVYLTDLQPYALANDGANLYWTNYLNGPGSVVTCPVGATCNAPRTVALNQDLVFAIAANATSVFWTTSTSVYRADK